LTWVEANQSASTHALRVRFLQPFSDHCGKLPVGHLKKHHLEAWLASKRGSWNSSTCCVAVSSVSAALNWAADMGLISKNPITKLKRPQQKSRSAYCVITDEQHATLTAEADKRTEKGFLHILVVLRQTGARPGEIRLLEARHYRPDQGAWVIDASERNGNNKLGHRGKRRVIYIPPGLIPLVEELNRRYPTGTIFPNEDGTAYSEGAIRYRFHHMKRRLGLPSTISLYGYRHRFATDWLAAGKPVGHLAELLGTSIAMIQKHYSHLTERASTLRAALADFMPGAAAASSTGGAASPSSATAPVA
jgi:integrase